MVMTRRARRAAEQDDELHNAAIPLLLPPTHQGDEAQSAPNILAAETYSLKSPSKKVPSGLTTTAEAKIDKPPLKMLPVVKPCSMATLGRYPTQVFKRVPCRRNKSTAAVGAMKKDINDDTVAYKNCANNPLSEIYHNQLIDVNVELISNEDKALAEVIMPIDEDRSDGQSQADSNARQSTSINLSAMDSLDDDGSISNNSEISSAAVTIGGYKVKEELAPILRDILSKYGDIAAQCCKKSIMLRSLLVENVCDIVKKLQTADFVYLTPVEVDNFRVFVQDMESDGVEVEWLLHRLNEIYEAKSLLKGSSKVKRAKSESHRAIMEKEEQICELQKQIASAEKELEVERTEERRLDEILSYTKAQVKRFHCGSMIDGLL